MFFSNNNSLNIFCAFYRWKRQKGFFETKLYEYFQTVKTKETETQKSYKLPSGVLKFKKSKFDFEYDKNSGGSYGVYSRWYEKNMWMIFDKKITI